MLKQLPPPSGPFHVGVTHLSFVDEDRFDTHSPAIKEHPNIPVLIWYPIDEPDVQEKNYCITEALLNQIENEKKSLKKV